MAFEAPTSIGALCRRLIRLLRTLRFIGMNRTLHSELLSDPTTGSDWFSFEQPRSGSCSSANRCWTLSGRASGEKLFRPFDAVVPVCRTHLRYTSRLRVSPRFYGVVLHISGACFNVFHFHSAAQPPLQDLRHPMAESKAVDRTHHLGHPSLSVRHYNPSSQGLNALGQTNANMNIL